MESQASMAPTPRALPYYVAFSQLLGLTVVAMTGAWLGLYRGGIAWESALQFNVHPLCMVIGLVFLQGDALLVYRVFRNEAKRATKILHGLLHVFAFIIALVGLVAVFDYHRKKGYPDLYSLHSWCGILVFVLYFAQWLVGFSFFLFPGASFSLRTRYRPLHIFFGAAIFLLSTLQDPVQHVRARGRPGQHPGPAAGQLRCGCGQFWSQKLRALKETECVPPPRGSGCWTESRGYREHKAVGGTQGPQ
uniref:Transmembrane ascorbate-dependent reductase CYB561 n=1 Tax=Rousettus aegyptiacus TaxID=9407 RepID=A0A7J8G7C8_ROUAE|nr:cytochrome b561 [Rousettus aegyptiacus]